MISHCLVWSIVNRGLGLRQSGVGGGKTERRLLSRLSIGARSENGTLSPTYHILDQRNFFRLFRKREFVVLRKIAQMSLNHHSLCFALNIEQNRWRRSSQKTEIIYDFWERPFFRRSIISSLVLMVTSMASIVFFRLATSLLSASFSAMRFPLRVIFPTLLLLP